MIVLDLVVMVSDDGESEVKGANCEVIYKQRWILLLMARTSHSFIVHSLKDFL